MGSKRSVRTALVALPVLFVLAGLAHPWSASAATRPEAFQYPTCFCGAGFNRDGFAEHGSISWQQGSTFIHLSLPGRRELILRAGKGVVNVMALDVDRDGDADLVAVKTNLRIRVWLNNGHGKFVLRNKPNFSASVGSKLLVGDPRQVGALNGWFSCEDGAGLVGNARTAIGPEISEARGLECGERPAKDAFLASIHQRGPPAAIA